MLTWSGPLLTAAFRAMSSKKDTIAKLEAEKRSLQQQLEQLENAISGEKAAELLVAAMVWLGVSTAAAVRLSFMVTLFPCDAFA